MKGLICKIVRPINQLFAAIPEWVVNLSIRVLVFQAFWFSAQKKISGLTLFGQDFAFWNINQKTFFLFDFKYDVPFIPSDVAAYVCTIGEFFLSLMVLFGLLTRFAALGLMVILAVQYVHPDAWWNLHVYWFVMALYLMRNGGGQCSIDGRLFK